MAASLPVGSRVVFALPVGHPEGPGERTGTVSDVWDGETAVVEWSPGAGWTETIFVPVESCRPV